MRIIATWGMATPLIFLVLCACSGSDWSSEKTGDDQVAEQHSPNTDEQFVPFPKAKVVQLYIDESGLGNLDKAIAAGIVDTLTAEERTEFEEALVVSKADQAVSCFIPNHFFRYVDENGSVMGDVSICFSCGGNEVSPSPELPKDGWIKEDINRIEALVERMGHPTDV